VSRKGFDRALQREQIRRPERTRGFHSNFVSLLLQALANCRCGFRFGFYFMI
jgi:hypothetical protein